MASLIVGLFTIGYILFMFLWAYGWCWFIFLWKHHKIINGRPHTKQGFFGTWIADKDEAGDNVNA